MTEPNRIELNEAQRRAVMHGSGSAVCSPLLVIAGAGSGKTNTLAHRVAHVVSEGADPARLLLLTFSRRAAQELERRAGRVLAAKRKQHTSDRPPTFPWAGTFHGIGARILREYAERLGLAPNFTIHDRGDSEDLMGLVRHAHVADGATSMRFPGAATCLAIYSRVVNAESTLTDVLSDRYPWCASHSERLRGLFDAYVAAKQAQQILDFDDLLIYWAAMMRVPGVRSGSRRSLRSCDGRRVSGHEHDPGNHCASAQAERARCHRRRRRRAGDLQLSRRHGP